MEDIMRLNGGQQTLAELVRALDRRWLPLLRIARSSRERQNDVGYTLRMDWPGTGLEGPGKAARPHAGSGSSSSRSDMHHRWSVDRYTNGGRPGSVLAQKLVGASLPLIKCDNCPKKIVRRVSTTPEHPGWVFIKCLNDGVCAIC